MGRELMGDGRADRLLDDPPGNPAQDASHDGKRQQIPPRSQQDGVRLASVKNAVRHRCRKRQGPQNAGVEASHNSSQGLPLNFP